MNYHSLSNCTHYIEKRQYKSFSDMNHYCLKILNINLHYQKPKIYSPLDIHHIKTDLDL